MIYPPQLPILYRHCFACLLPAVSSLSLLNGSSTSTRLALFYTLMHPLSKHAFQTGPCVEIQSRFTNPRFPAFHLTLSKMISLRIIAAKTGDVCCKMFPHYYRVGSKGAIASVAADWRASAQAETQNVAAMTCPGGSKRRGFL